MSCLFGLRYSDIMGGRESKQSCISYEDAIKRVSESELRRLKDSFKRSAGIGRLYLNRNAFQHDVLCEGVPSKVADLLYTACGGSQKGITFKDLLCGLVLLTRGTEDEKVRFLWNLFCNDAGNCIHNIDYIRTVGLNPLERVSLFHHTDRVSFEQFQEWILEHKDSSTLSSWLLSGPSINLTSELETATFYQSLAGVTHLEEKDIADLEKEFWCLKNSSPNTQLDLQLLGPLISPPIPKTALIGLFNAFDENRDGHIDFKELCCGVSAACRGPEVERTRFCFKIFDIDRDGVLNHNEITQMINVLIFVAKESRNAHLYKDMEKKEALDNLLSFTTRKRKSSAKEDLNILLEAYKHEDSVTAEDFMIWSVESNLNLVQPFLDLTFEVCHIVFGLWPQCKHLEHSIVCGWLEREKKRHYRVGQFWYLISHDWWLAWTRYTQSNAFLCDYCKKIPFQRNSNGLSDLVDEALACDESLNSNSLDMVNECVTAPDNCSVGSTSSAVSTDKLSEARPGPIDNLSLIKPNIFKNVRTLTGEGGHLRRDTPLVENHDFHLVPKSLWKALNRWYGDNLPLPRQVIRMSKSSELELELYPLNLRIVLHQSTVNTANINNWGVVSGGYGIVASGGGYAAISSNVPQPPKRYLAYTAAFSQLATVHQICEFLCIQLRLKTEDVRLWHIPLGSLENNAILLEVENMTLKDLLIKDNDQILLEIRNKDLTWPEELGSLALNQNGGIYLGEHHFSRSSITSIHAPGATGLHNLGNTCFLNAALQVLFNTQPLAQYFRLNMHLFELNTANKLGTRGQLALRYGELLKEMWGCTSRSVAPLKLRFCVTKNAPQFAGGGQHDSQELLEWFLDALHEDLNRVTEKPYGELKDSNGRPDSIVATEAWIQHHARNQSVVVDLFYGQLKSKVNCLGCGQESVRFDPFNLLSLPLPVENFVYFEVLVVLLDGSVPIKYGFRLSADSRYIDFKEKLSTLCFLKPNFMLVCEVYNSQIKLILMDKQKVTPATAKSLYVYQLPEDCSDRSRSSSMNIEKGLKDIQRSAALVTSNDTNVSFTSAHSNQVQNWEIQGPNNAESEDANGSSRLTNKKNNPPSHDNDEDLYSTKQSVDVRQSPENTFAEEYRKHISSTKLLCSEKNVFSSPFLKQHENESTDSFVGQMPYSSSSTCNNSDCFESECQCKLSSTQISTEARDISCLNNNHNTINTIATNESMIGLYKALEANEILSDCHATNTKSNEFESDMRLPSSDAINGSRIFRDIVFQQFRVGKYLIAVHRKITRQNTYFLSHHKTRPSLFGVPLLIPKVENGTHKDLYLSVWLQVNRLLSPLPAFTDQSNHAADCDDSLGYDFPFTLRAVKGDGLTCAVCNWTNFCRGCEIPCNDDYLLKGIQAFSNSASPSPSAQSVDKVNDSEEKSLSLQNEELSDIDSISDFTIAIDWDPTALHLRYQSSLERLCKEHESIATCRMEQIEPVDLNHCLRAFTSEEKLEEWYHCGHCKGKKPATKKLQIWKLPPILIVHLKRFNCVNEKWVKSQKVVHFPFDNFDPTPYLASVPQETILRHKELWELNEEAVETEEENENKNKSKNKNEHKLTGIEECEVHGSLQHNNDSNREDDEKNKSIERELRDNGNSPDPVSRNNLINSKNCPQIDECCNIVNVHENMEFDDGDEDDHIQIDQLPVNEVNSQRTQKAIPSINKLRRRLISTSLTKTPVIDGEFEDFHQHKLGQGENKFDLKYKLYAVVCHSGLLNGGHYVAYAANQNGTWYCFNDSSCREIPSQPNIDPSSAYLLFYERKGLDYEPYLPSIDQNVFPNGVLDIDSDDGSNDLKKLCRIS